MNRTPIVEWTRSTDIEDRLRTAAKIERLEADLKDQRELYRHDVAKLMDKIERLEVALDREEQTCERLDAKVLALTLQVNELHPRQQGRVDE